MENLTEFIYEKHTETCGGQSGIGCKMESLEESIIDRAIENMPFPTIADVLSHPLEDLRCDDDQTADDLLRRAIEDWIGSKCLDVLCSDSSFDVTVSSLFSSFAVPGKALGTAFSPVILRAREVGPVDNMTWQERVYYIAMARACVAAKREMEL